VAGTGRARQWIRRAGIAGTAAALVVSALATAASGATATRQTGVAVGEAHQCALSATGVVKCWGRNGEGQVGNGDATGAFVPKPVTVLTGAAGISTGDDHTCAVMHDATVKCWGRNDAGEIGNGGRTDAIKPTTVKGVGGTGVLNGVDIVVAGGDHTCALMKNKTVKCWGQNNEGVLGNGTIKNALTPVSVTGLQRVTTLTLSAQVACASLQAGTVKCWGYTGDGELGVGPGQETCEFGEFSHSCARTPTTVKGVSNAIAVSAGQNHVCALLKNAQVECWGNSSTTPVIVRGLSAVEQIATNGLDGNDKSRALLKNGTVKYFPYDSKQHAPLPTAVGGIATASFIAIGGSTDCAVLTAGTVKCWGDNGTTATTPVIIQGL